MLKSVRNTAGNVLLQILVATAVMSTSFYFLTNYVIGQKEQAGKTINVVNLRFALNSAMDYVIFGVRQKYCFTNDTLLLNDSPDKCNLQHSGSIERLIMSAEQENFIRQLVANGQSVGPVDVNNIALAKIERYIRVSDASALHPLFPVLKNLRMVKGEDGKPVAIDGISVEIIRDNSAYLPKAGREVYLQLKVSLKTDKAAEPLKIGRTVMSLGSQLVIYPREVGSFALLVPNDLHLDTTWDAGMSPGDISIHKFSNRKELGNGQGLVFQSPVFVNRNIHLPLDQGSGEENIGDTQYAAVTFADRVYLGNGWVMSNGNRYSPRSTGGLQDRYWADARTFGGFLKGIENDGGSDKGLDYFKVGPGGSVSSSLSDSLALMKLCTEQAMNNASRDNLFKSELGAKLTDSSTDNFDYRAFLSRGNEFLAQTNALKIKTDNWGNGKVEVANSLVLGGNAVVNLRIGVADKYAEVQLPAKGYAKVTVPVGSDQLRSKYENAQKLAEDKLAAEKAKYDDLLKDLGNAQANLKSKNDELDAEESKPVKPKTGADPKVDYQDPAVISALESEISTLKSQIKDLTDNKIPTQSSAVNLATSNVDAAKGDYGNYMNVVANPPVIEVTTTRYKSFFGYVAPDKINVNFTVKNSKNFLSADGILVAPVVGIQAYDGGYYQSNPIEPSSVNSNLLGYLNFKFNGSKTALEAPYSVSRKPAESAVGLTESDVDYGSLSQQCIDARNSVSTQSFGGAGWGTDFSASTRISWNFAGGTTVGKDPGLDELILKDMTRSNASFQVRSIVGKCVIESTAEFVTGFFTCDLLEIKARSAPLRIIGTVIAGKMRIHPDALKAGITWSTIYSPQATQELRAAGILKPLNGSRKCDDKNADPIWHPIPSVQQVSDRMSCNAISLRAAADPFQWTSVDPDCGLMPGSTSSNTTCKRRLVRFYVVEQSREGGL